MKQGNKGFSLKRNIPVMGINAYLLQITINGLTGAIGMNCKSLETLGECSNLYFDQ